MGANSWAKNTSNTPKLIRPIYPIGPKVWNIVNKKDVSFSKGLIMEVIKKDYESEVIKYIR